jgi:hypothetical protein
MRRRSDSKEGGKRYPSIGRLHWDPLLGCTRNSVRHSWTVPVALTWGAEHDQWPTLVRDACQWTTGN